VWDVVVVVVAVGWASSEVLDRAYLLSEKKMQWSLLQSHSLVAFDRQYIPALQIHSKQDVMLNS
jgi:hypothetical protein